MNVYIVILLFVGFSLIGTFNYWISKRYADKKSHTIPGSAIHTVFLLKAYWIAVVIETIILSVIVII